VHHNITALSFFLKAKIEEKLYLLSDKKVSFVVLEELVELQNVWMVHLLENGNLAKEFLLFLLFEILLVDDLDSSEGFGLLVQALANLTVRTYTQSNTVSNSHLTQASNRLNCLPLATDKRSTCQALFLKRNINLIRWYQARSFNLKGDLRTNMLRVRKLVESSSL
jgi:hypothetical protein